MNLYIRRLTMTKANWISTWRRIELDIIKLLTGLSEGGNGSHGLLLDISDGVGYTALTRQPVHSLSDDQVKKDDGFVWGVPKKRKSLQKRWCVNMGAEQWYWKMLIPKYNLRICETCGHHYEAKHLCRNCYERIKTETDEIRKKIEGDLGNNPECESLLVVYKNERQGIDGNELKPNTRIVEMPKERPQWFSKNLLQKTTAEPDPNTTTLIPTKSNLS